MNAHAYVQSQGGQSRRGFTLVELLVALAIVAIMTIVAWRSVNGMQTRSARIVERSSALSTIQVGLQQWQTDWDQLRAVPNLPITHFDGRVLRMVRRSPIDPTAVQVVAWMVRNVTTVRASSSMQWVRWHSRDLQDPKAADAAWDQAQNWSQGGGTTLQEPGESSPANSAAAQALLAAQSWTLYYFRENTWVHPQSSDSADCPPDKPCSPNPYTLAEAPAAVRLQLSLPQDSVLPGMLTLDWLRSNFSTPK